MAPRHCSRTPASLYLAVCGVHVLYCVWSSEVWSSQTARSSRVVCERERSESASCAQTCARSNAVVDTACTRQATHAHEVRSRQLGSVLDVRVHTVGTRLARRPAAPAGACVHVPAKTIFYLAQIRYGIQYGTGGSVFTVYARANRHLRRSTSDTLGHRVPPRRYNGLRLIENAAWQPISTAQ